VGDPFSLQKEFKFLISEFGSVVSSDPSDLSL